MKYFIYSIDGGSHFVYTYWTWTHCVGSWAHTHTPTLPIHTKRWEVFLSIQDTHFRLLNVAVRRKIKKKPISPNDSITSQFDIFIYFFPFDTMWAAHSQCSSRCLLSGNHWYFLGNAHARTHAFHCISFFFSTKTGSKLQQRVPF